MALGSMARGQLPLWMAASKVGGRKASPVTQACPRRRLEVSARCHLVSAETSWPLAVQLPASSLFMF